jgi:serine/threonine-protein kinase RsbW
MTSASANAQQGLGAAGAPPGLRPGLRWRRVFPGQERELGAMRRWLASLLPDSPARDDLATVATELCANTIRHTASGRGGWFAVEISWYGRVVRVAVADSGGPGKPRVIEDPSADSGRGLLLVRGLSLRTGVSGDQRGRLVWADVLWDGTDRGAAGVMGDPYEGAIRDGEAALARRFGGVPAWFGRSTLQWWALPDSGELVSAPSARELAALLHRLHAGRPARFAAVGRSGLRARERGARPRGSPGGVRVLSGRPCAGFGRASLAGGTA